MNVILLFLIIVFFICAFFFEGIETGLLSIDRLKLEHEAHDSRRKRDLLKFLERPERIFGTTLIGGNISNVMIASLVMYYVELNHWEAWEQYITLAMTILVLIFGQTIPKALFRDRANQLVPAVFPLLKGTYVALSPFVKLITRFNQRFSGLFNVNENNFQFLTREDLTEMLAETPSDENLHEHQREMLEEAMEFGELNAFDVMIPRTDIVAIPADATIEDAISVARKERFTRYPVYHNDLDHIVGILIVYDLIDVDSSSHDAVGTYVRDALFVPEKMDANALLKEMQTQKKSMAIVVDSYGGTAGLVTSEDILEEVVGDIEDEYDTETEESAVKKIDNNTYLVQGDVEMDELIDNFDLHLPHDGEYKTIAGLIIDKLARIPAPGQKLSIGEWRIEIVQVSSRQIQKVRLTRILPTNKP